jgi:hypothetical protein
MPNFLHTFPQPSTSKSHRPQFLHKREMFSYCGAQRPASECFKRIREIFSRLSNDDCGDAGGSWQFSRVNCQGKFGYARKCVPVARALRPPPLLAPLSGLGCQRSQRVHRSDSPNHGCAAGTGKSGTPWGALSDQYKSARRSWRREGKTRDPRTMRLGWLARAAFVFFCGLTSYSPFVLLASFFEIHGN